MSAKMLKMPCVQLVVGPNKPALLHSRTGAPKLIGACQGGPRRTSRAQIAQNCRRRKSLAATIMPEESASQQADTDDMDDFETKGGFRCLTSAG